jgi:hypothetical protein
MAGTVVHLTLLSLLPTRPGRGRRQAVSLYATIGRYDGVTTSLDEVVAVGRQLAFALSEASGFVSYAVLDAGDGVLVSITVFDDPTDLQTAAQLIDRWVAEHLAAVLPRPPAVVTGEVIVQRGM